ncbi:hypothetical protein [Nonomuraea sp. LPB2021202275-12-8]|uniref:hypothetical protein n=1 Tax=Nonomuraea sp. LPB2021202275-12-8 TaxID=3120159 RepID=UPI00300D9F3F
MTETLELGSRVITALEAAWAAIRTHHPDVPRVVVITGQGDRGYEVTWGHFAAGTWNVDDGHVSELFASGEMIALGGRRVMETLLHEAAHGLADVRRIKDTSNKHRYHNKEFVKLAKHLGLEPPAVADKVMGWSRCRITDATAERYRETISALDAERLPYRSSAYVTYLRKWGDDDELGDDPGATTITVGEDDDQDGVGETPLAPPGPTPVGRDGVRITIACACVPARKMQSSPGSFERGPVTCGACNTDFVQAEPQRRSRRRPRAL